MENALVAKMVSDPNLTFEKEPSTKSLDLQIRSRSCSSVGAMGHERPASNDDGDEDYVDEGPRKSDRRRKATEKARRKRVTLTLREVQKDRFASVFPPGFDRGRFPLQRRV